MQLPAWMGSIVCAFALASSDAFAQAVPTDVGSACTQTAPGGTCAEAMLTRHCQRHERRDSSCRREERLREERIHEEQLHDERVREQRVHDERVREQRLHEERVREERLRSRRRG